MRDDTCMPSGEARSGSLKQGLLKAALSKKGLLVLAVVFMIGISVLLYLAHIDWERHISTYGYLGIFVVMLVSSMTIILPLPGVAVLAAAPTIMGLRERNSSS